MRAAALYGNYALIALSERPTFEHRSQSKSNPSCTTAFYLYCRTRDGWSAQQRLAVTVDSNCRPFFKLHFQLALDSNTAVIAADGNPFRDGYADVFQRSGAEWKHVQLLQRAAPSSNLVYSIQVCNGMIAVGWHGNDMNHDQGWPRPFKEKIGLYRRSGEGWTLFQTISHPSGDSSSHYYYFGESLVLKKDCLAVSCTGETMEGGRTRGAVYVYVPEKRSGVWGLQQKILPWENGGGGNWYGGTIVANTESLLIARFGKISDCSSRDCSMTAFYERKGNSWTYRQRDPSVDTSFSRHAWYRAIALADNFLLETEERGKEPNLKVYHRRAGQWERTVLPASLQSFSKPEFGFLILSDNRNALIGWDTSEDDLLPLYFLSEKGAGR